jgi:hypothetical protein
MSANPCNKNGRIGPTAATMIAAEKREDGGGGVLPIGPFSLYAGRNI